MTSSDREFFMNPLRLLAIADRENRRELLIASALAKELNTAQIGLPNRTIDLPQAGIISGNFAPPRQIQLALRLQF